MAIPEERRVTPIERSVVYPPFPTTRVSWGGVWSGFLVGLGALLLLSVLGLAVGISAVDVGGSGVGSRGLGIGTGVWAGLSLLIALFVGGMVAARMGRVADRAAAAMQGTLVWVLSVLGLIYLGVSGVSLGASALFGVLGGVTRTVGSAVGTRASGLSDLSSGDVDQLLVRLSDPRTVDTVAAATGMSTAEARSTLSELRARVEAARNDPARAAAEAREGIQALAARAQARAGDVAAAAQPYAAATGWIAFAAMVLSLLAALGGATWGGSRAAARLAQR